MSTTYSPITLLYTAKLLGVTGAGLLTGFNACFCIGTTPGLLGADLPPAKLVHAWNEVYDSAAPFAIGTTLATAVSFFYSAYEARQRSQAIISKVPLTILGMTEATQLTLAGVGAISGFVFTAIFMMPTSIKRLKEMRAAIQQAEKKRLEPTVDKAAVQSDVVHWTRLVAVRAAIFGSAFVLGLTAL